MKELATKIVDGESYEFSQMGAKEALRMLTRLAKIVGKPVALTISSLKKPEGGDFLDTEINMDFVGSAVEALVQNLEQNEVLDIIETLCAKNALCNGAKIIFNSHYESRLGHLFKVLWAALEVQYGNFFDVLREVPGISRRKPPAPATIPEPAQ